MTIKTKLIAAGALVAASFAAIPAANAGGLTVEFGFGAPGYVHYDRGHRGYGDRHRYEHRRFISERRVHRILRHNGFRHANIWRQGPFYVAKAVDRRGRDVRVRLSAFDGDIISVRRVGGRRWH